MKNIKDNDKIKIIDKIIQMYPDMEKERNNIIKEIMTPSKKTIDDEYVLERVTINGIYYYRDKYKCLLDANADVMGVWEYDKGQYVYYVYDKEYADSLKTKLNDGIPESK